MPNERNKTAQWITAGAFCFLMAGLAWVPVVGPLFDATTWPACMVATGMVMVTVGRWKRIQRASP